MRDKKNVLALLESIILRLEKGYRIDYRDAEALREVFRFIARTPDLTAKHDG